MEIQWKYEGLPEYRSAKVFHLDASTLPRLPDIFGIRNYEYRIGPEGDLWRHISAIGSARSDDDDFRPCPFTGRLELHLFIGKAQRMVWLTLEEGKLIQAEDVTDIAIGRLQLPLGEE